MSSTTYVKLRRLAPRSIRVLGRRAGSSPALAAFVPTLEPKARAFIAAYDQAKKNKRIYVRELGEGHGAVGALKTKMMAWLPSLARDLPSYDPSDATERTAVPDDAITAAQVMIETVEEALEEGVNLPFAAALLEDVGGAYATAVKEWSEADAVEKTRRDLLTMVRETGALFDAELQLFRRVLYALGGRGDADYQKLRILRASVPDPDDDPETPEDEPALAAEETVPGKKLPTSV